MADSKGVQYSPTGFEDDSLASTLLREVHSLSGGDGDGESDGFRLEAAGTVSVAQVSADTGGHSYLVRANVSTSSRASIAQRTIIWRERRSSDKTENQEREWTKRQLRHSIPGNCGEFGCVLIFQATVNLQPPTCQLHSSSPQLPRYHQLLNPAHDGFLARPPSSAPPELGCRAQLPAARHVALSKQHPRPPGLLPQDRRQRCTYLLYTI